MKRAAALLLSLFLCDSGAVAIASSGPAASCDIKARSAIEQLVARRKRWKARDFAIEKKGATGDSVMYWVIYLPEMKHAQAGGGESFGIYYDCRRERLSSEVYFQ